MYFNMRSTWKGPFTSYKTYTNLCQTKKKVFFLKKKNSTILPEFVGLIVKIYNGYRFVDLTILSSMVGYKFGSFISTRKLHVFKTK